MMATTLFLVLLPQQQVVAGVAGHQTLLMVEVGVLVAVEQTIRHLVGLVQVLRDTVAELVAQIVQVVAEVAAVLEEMPLVLLRGSGVLVLHPL
jgi:hypothetical protein